MRTFIPSLCLEPVNGAESFIRVGMLERPEKLDTNVQYESLVTFRGSNLLTGEGGSAYMESRKLEDVNVKDALRLYGVFETLRADSDKRFKTKQ